MRSINKLQEFALLGEVNKDWYKNAKINMALTAKEKDWDLNRYIDVMAITSPRVSVKRNMYLAEHYMTHGQHASFFMPNIRAGLDHYELTGEIRGPKTSEFAKAIRGDGSAVVLDVWMARAFNVEQKDLDKKDIRNKAIAYIRRLSNRLSWTCAEVQAAIWYTACLQGGRVNVGTI